MNNPIVIVKEKKYSVSHISVILKLNYGPLIHLRLSEKLDNSGYKLSNEETFKQEFFQDISQEEEGSFEWGGKTLNFVLVGYNSTEARTFDLVGLVVKKSLLEWFNINEFRKATQKYLIYQKDDGNSWPFFSNILGKKFEKPDEYFIRKLDLLFPEHGCICRDRESNNFDFLNRAIAYTSRYLSEVQGWCAFDSDKPLRLILFDKNNQSKIIPRLDQTWNPSYSFLPNRYSWDRWLDESCSLSREISVKKGKEMELIQQLVSEGSNGEDDKKGQNFQEQNPTRLLFSPGTIRIGNKNVFCHTVRYEFKLPAFLEEETPSVTMKIEFNDPKGSISGNEVISLRLLGKFKEWKETKENTKVIKIGPCDLNNWGVVDKSGQSLKQGEEAVLHTEILSPTYSEQDYSGIYIKHEKDDEMILDINPCGVPLVLGSLQKYRPKLEEADVTVCGQKIAISVSPDSQGLEESEAILIDSSKIQLNHQKEIIGNAAEKIDLVSEKDVNINSSEISINSEKEVGINSNKTEIKSKVNITSPSSGNGASSSSGNSKSSSSAAGNGSSANGNNDNVIVATPASSQGSPKKENEEEEKEKEEEKDIITIDDQYHFKVGSASGENNLCLLDTLAQLIVEQTPYKGSAEELKKQFKEYFADDTALIEFGEEINLRDPNICENFLLAYGLEYKENYEIQVYQKLPDEKNKIIKYKPRIDVKEGAIGVPPGSKTVTFNILYEDVGEGKHHFDPLFPCEQVGESYISEEKELPEELLGGGPKYKYIDYLEELYKWVKTQEDEAKRGASGLGADKPRRQRSYHGQRPYQFVSQLCDVIQNLLNQWLKTNTIEVQGMYIEERLLIATNEADSLRVLLKEVSDLNSLCYSIPNFEANESRRTHQYIAPTKKATRRHQSKVWKYGEDRCKEMGLVMEIPMIEYNIGDSWQIKCDEIKELLYGRKEKGRVILITGGSYKSDKRKSPGVHAEQKLMRMLLAAKYAQGMAHLQGTQEIIIAGKRRPCMGCNLAYRYLEQVEEIKVMRNEWEGRMWSTTIITVEEMMNMSRRFRMLCSSSTDDEENSKVQDWAKNQTRSMKEQWEELGNMTLTLNKKKKTVQNPGNRTDSSDSEVEYVPEASNSDSGGSGAATGSSGGATKKKTETDPEGRKKKRDGKAANKRNRSEGKSTAVDETDSESENIDVDS